MYKKLKQCLCCDNSNLYPILDLNSQPLANSYLKNKEDDEDVFPLGINFCKKCSHVQLTHAVDPNKLFRNYLYVSGTSKTLSSYFEWFVTFCNKYVGNKNILDIACNDGTQLDHFKSDGYETYGIDPAENLYDISSKKHNIICDFLTQKSIEKFDKKFDLITAVNVFPHNSYPKEFLNICMNSLSDSGHLIIQTSQCDMFKKNQFDTIYHEHISFFTVKSFCTLAKKVGLKIIDVRRVSIHDKSFIFVLSKNGQDRSDEFIELDYKSGNEIDIDFMKKYAENSRKIAFETQQKIDEIKSKGYKIIGYGAAAKGNTFINFSKFNLEYIVDDNPLKHNLYAPGSRIPIYSPDKLQDEEDKICVVPLAWNFFDEIKEKVDSRITTKRIFLKYFPEVSVQ